MLYAGIDVHKKCCQCYVEDTEGKMVRSARVESTPKEILAFFDYLPDKPKIAIEACGIKDNIIDVLYDHGFEVLVSNPYKNRLIAEAKVKTDKIDSKVLADLLRADMLASVYYPPKAIRLLRDLVHQRVYYVRQKTACKNRIHRILLRNGVHAPQGKPFTKQGIDFLQRKEYPNNILVHQLLETMESYTQSIEKLNDQIKETGHTFREIRILRTAYGIDWFNAAVIWSQIGNIKRFKDHKKFVGLTGLYPTIHQSGEREYKGSLARTGSSILRWALVQSALVCLKQDNQISRFYYKIEKKKGHKKAIVAAAHKLAIAIYYMLKNNQHFIPA